MTDDDNPQRRRARDWCILRTSGPRTLPLARSLATAGFDVWTPRQTQARRQGPARERVEYDAPILPTFVFARAARAADLAELLAQPLNPHPDFSIFRYYGRIPLIADRDIESLRAEEAEAAYRWQAVKEEAERQAEHERLKEEEAAQARQMHVERQQRESLRRALKATAPTYARGTKVTLPRPEFAGMTGVVEGQRGKAAIVNFGGGIALTIDAWLLSPDDLCATSA